MKPSEAKTLFEELNNDTATWWDAVFWWLVGALTASGVWWLLI